MKPPTDLTITIPAAIVALPGLNLIEKAVLNRIRERPACSNGGLAKLTGLSARGVESTLTRLRAAGLVRSTGKGRARRLELTLPVEFHTGGGDRANRNHHTGCGDAARASDQSTTYRATATSEIKDVLSPAYVRRELNGQAASMLMGDYAQARVHLNNLRLWQAALCEQQPEMRARSERSLQNYDNIIYIIQTCGQMFLNTSELERARQMKCLDEATPERLAEIRKLVEAAVTEGKLVKMEEVFLSSR